MLSILKAYHQTSSQLDVEGGFVQQASQLASPSSDTSLETLSDAVDDVLEELLAREAPGQGRPSGSSTAELVNVLNRTIFDLQSFLNTLDDHETDDIQHLRGVIQSFIDDLSLTVRYLLDCRLMSSSLVDWVDEEVAHDGWLREA
ncbi:MAG: hypothetical protein EA367_07695 [Leptolyngbya sp. DLM2.Bin15]|nr:MAG: hypothetical protein EA367_07695 [Leptolyngbya sp. DLM2.Bin15]